jgi:hypothetical protein
MKPHFVRATRNFGSFMCVQNLACLRRDDFAEVVEHGVPNPLTEGQSPAATEPLLPKPANRFGNFSQRIWLRLTGGKAETH